MPDLTLPQQLANRDSDRRRRYTDNLAFYNGDQWLDRISVSDAPRRQRRRLTLNYSRAFIDKTTSYMMNGMQIVAPPESESAEHTARAADVERTIREIADDQALEVLDFETETDCAVLGDACFKVTWAEDEQRVRITAPDMLGVFAWRRPDDLRDVWRVAQRYKLPTSDARALYGFTSSKRELTIIEDWTAATFELWADNALVITEPNPYGFIPYVLYPNIRKPKEEWGTSDVEQLRDAAREVNRAATQISQIIELSGNPIAVLENVTEATDIGVQPGAVWEIPEGAKAYLLDLLKGGGAKLAIDFLDVIRRMMHDLGESPPAAFGDNARGLSGVALNVQLDPLVKKVARKRLIRTPALITRTRMALRLLSQFAGLDAAIAEHPLRVEWGDLLPNDRSQDIADALNLTNAGIWSRRRAADTVGEVDDPDAELAQWLDESERITAVQPAQAPSGPRAGPSSS